MITKFFLGASEFFGGILSSIGGFFTGGGLAALIGSVTTALSALSIPQLLIGGGLLAGAGFLIYKLFRMFKTAKDTDKMDTTSAGLTLGNEEKKEKVKKSKKSLIKKVTENVFAKDDKKLEKENENKVNLKEVKKNIQNVKLSEFCDEIESSMTQADKNETDEVLNQMIQKYGKDYVAKLSYEEMEDLYNETAGVEVDEDDVTNIRNDENKKEIAEKADDKFIPYPGAKVYDLSSNKGLKEFYNSKEYKTKLSDIQNYDYEMALKMIEQKEIILPKDIYTKMRNLIKQGTFGIYTDDKSKDGLKIKYYILPSLNAKKKLPGAQIKFV